MRKIFAILLVFLAVGVYASEAEFDREAYSIRHNYNFVDSVKFQWGDETENSAVVQYYDEYKVAVIIEYRNGWVFFSYYQMPYSEPFQFHGNLRDVAIMLSGSCVTKPDRIISTM